MHQAGFPGGSAVTVKNEKVMKKKKSKADTVKNPPVNAGDAGDKGSVPGSLRSPEVGNGNLLWYSCLGNPIGLASFSPWVTKSQTRLHDRAQTHTALRTQNFWKTFIFCKGR